MFIGGLNWETTDEGLQRYFSQFGKVTHCTIMRDGTTGRSRGFAFLTFADPATVNTVLVKEHFLDGKIIDPKRALSRSDGAKTARCFVGSIPQTATPAGFRQLFERFGEVVDANLMMDNQTGKPRGYGFVTYAQDSSVDTAVGAQPLTIDGQQIEVKRAQPRSEAKEALRNKGNAQRGVGGAVANRGAYGVRGSPPPPLPGQMPGMAAGGGAFDPQAMAQLFQQTGWGNNFNPMMFQQMMMGGALGGMGMPGMQGGMQGMPGMPGMGMPGMQGMPGMGMPMAMPGAMGGWGGNAGFMQPQQQQQAGGYGGAGGGAGAGGYRAPPQQRPPRAQQQRSPEHYRDGGNDSRGSYQQQPNRASGLPPRPDVQGDRGGYNQSYGGDGDGGEGRGRGRRSRSPYAKPLAGGNYDRERSPHRGQQQDDNRGQRY